MTEPFNLKRFVDAQNPVYAEVCRELKEGLKTGHWMWFIFPQLDGLGHSAMAAKFAIRSLEEARVYLNHPVLGPRLIECTELVNAVSGYPKISWILRPETAFTSSVHSINRGPSTGWFR